MAGVKSVGSLRGAAVAVGLGGGCLFCHKSSQEGRGLWGATGEVWTHLPLIILPVRGFSLDLWTSELPHTTNLLINREIPWKNFERLLCVRTRACVCVHVGVWREETTGAAWRESRAQRKPTAVYTSAQIPAALWRDKQEVSSMAWSSCWGEHLNSWIRLTGRAVSVVYSTNLFPLFPILYFHGLISPWVSMTVSCCDIIINRMLQINYSLSYLAMFWAQKPDYDDGWGHTALSNLSSSLLHDQCWEGYFKMYPCIGYKIQKIQKIHETCCLLFSIIYHISANFITRPQKFNKLFCEIVQAFHVMYYINIMHWKAVIHFYY